MSEAFAFGEFELSPAIFAGLPEHGKSELCRLLRERGWKLARILQICGIAARDFNDFCFARHAVDMGDHLKDRVVAVPDGPLTAKQKDAVTDGLSLHHCRLLVRFPHSGVAYWKNQRAMEMDAGLAFGHGPKIIGALYDSKLVERAAPKRGYEQCWALTELGADLRSSMNPEDVQSVRKAK